VGRLKLKSRHRVLCGDSTSEEDVARVMGGETASMLFTDPPYGMRLDADYKKRPSDSGKVRANYYEGVVGDDADYDPGTLLQVFQGARTVLLWGADWYYDRLPPGGCFVIWNKRTQPGMKEMLGNHFETCWSREKRRRVVYDHQWAGFTARNRGFRREHPTEKPIALIAQMMQDFDDDFELIADPFLGSGTTLIAAEQLDRRCFGLEIEPRYCDVIVRRWQALTGEQAVHAETGEVFGS
jgi:DNA modification methylase